MMKSRPEEFGMVMFRRRPGLLLMQMVPGLFLGGILVDSLTFHFWLDFAELPLLWDQIKLVLVAPFSLLVTMHALRELLERSTRLGADGSGLWVVPSDESSGYRIPWRAVREVAYRVEKPRRARPLHWLELRLEPGACTLPAWHGNGPWIDLPLWGLEQPPAEVYAALRGRWERWRRRAIAKSFRGP